MISSMYSNTSQTCGSKLAKFSNSRFLSLFFTSKLAVPLLSTQIRNFCYFLSPKIREFGGITVFSFSKLPFWYKKNNLELWNTLYTTWRPWKADMEWGAHDSLQNLRGCTDTLSTQPEWKTSTKFSYIKNINLKNKKLLSMLKM